MATLKSGKGAQVDRNQLRIIGGNGKIVDKQADGMNNLTAQ